MRSKSRKQVIFSEAARLFRDKGYPSTSVREIAHNVGIEPSSIYSHIKSKEDILKKICWDAAEYFKSGMARIRGSAKSPEEMVDELIDLHLDAVISHPTTMTVFSDEWKHLPEPDLHQFLSIRKSYELQWKEIIKSGQENGSFMNGEAAIIVKTFISSMRWVYRWQSDDKRSEIEIAREVIKGILIKGLKNH